jgi:hypothetical protein
LIKATAAAFLVCVLAFNGYVLTRPNPYHLTMEMSANAPSTAEVFFDTGKSFNEGEASSLLVKSTALTFFQPLEFTIPFTLFAHRIRTIRFDPISAPGEVVIRHVSVRAPDGREILAIPPGDIARLNQIATIAVHGAEADVTTTPQAPDPQLTLSLKTPIRLPRVPLPSEGRLLLVGNAVLLGLFALLFVLRRQVEIAAAVVNRRVRAIDARFAALAEHLSAPDFIKFDSGAIWFYAACLVLFLAGGLADFNGSSIGAMSTYYGHGATEKEWIGQPRSIRADEWAFVTPDILNQALRTDAFALEDAQMGNHSVSLMANVPVRHFSTIFRPQFWSFFILPLDYAFAFMWQCKALFLAVGVFTWLLLLTGSTLASATGSLWYFFSQFTQWTWSWPSALPELTGMICLSMVLFCYLTVGKNKIALALVALAAAVCSINFALCAYVPHLIPLAWLAVLFFLAWCIASHRQIFVKEAAAARIAAGAVAIAIIGVTGLFVYRDLQVAIAAITNTVYPGHRIVSGSMLVWQLPSNFMQWWVNDGRVPQLLHNNICEISGFLWLAPFTILGWEKVSLSRFQKLALAGFGLVSLLLLAWALLKLPNSFGIALGVARTFGPRSLPALGLANIAVVCTCMAGWRARAGESWNWQPAIMCVFVMGILFKLLQVTNRHLDHFFKNGQVFFAALIITVLVWLLITGRKRLLALALVLPQAIVFGTVNPVHRGLDVITSSEFYAFVQHHPDLRKGEWLVFTDPNWADRFDPNTASSLIAATGCHVYTTCTYLPNVDAFPLFRASHLNMEIANQLGYTTAVALPPGAKPSMQVISSGQILYRLSPSDPLLRQLGITHIAFDRKPAPALTSGLTLIADKEVDGLWLYRISDTGAQNK